MSTHTSQNNDPYVVNSASDDELDENFDTKLANHLANDEDKLEETLESFENPKGIDLSENEHVHGENCTHEYDQTQEHVHGKNCNHDHDDGHGKEPMNMDVLKRLLDQLSQMPEDKRVEFMKALGEHKNSTLNRDTNLSKISNQTALSARDKLRIRQQQFKLQRSSNKVREDFEKKNKEKEENLTKTDTTNATTATNDTDSKPVKVEPLNKDDFADLLDSSSNDDSNKKSGKKQNKKSQNRRLINKRK